MSVKNLVASKAATGVQCLHDTILHVAEFFGATTSVLYTLEICFVFVNDTMMFLCKFANATGLHMLLPRRQDRAKPMVGRVE